MKKERKKSGRKPLSQNGGKSIVYHLRCRDKKQHKKAIDLGPDWHRRMIDEA